MNEERDVAGLLDNGLKTYALLEKSRNCARPSDLIEFTDKNNILKSLAKDLEILLINFRKQPTNSRIRKIAIADYIYESNKIEGEHIDRDATINIVMERIKREDNHKWGTEDERSCEKMTYALANLVMNEYTPKISIYEKTENTVILASGTVADWKRWHFDLMEGNILASPGKLRHCGVYASEHTFPHHSIIEKALERLQSFIFNTSRNISSKFNCDDSNTIAKVFGLAAATQFYFVDIHPFCDGNGRMCRFLSKKILDTILPLPFKQFRDRDRYLSAISSSSPEDLCILMLEEAIFSYKSFIKFCDNTEESKKTELIDTNSKDEVIKMCNYLKLSENDTLLTLEKWKETSWNKAIKIVVNEGKLTLTLLHPMTESDIDDI